MRHFTNEERRARLGIRHALVSTCRTQTVEAAVHSVVALHATDPATVYLSYWARSQDAIPDQLDQALYLHRNVVKQLAMRRTLFVFPRDLLAATWGSVSARVARAEAARIAKQIENADVARDGVVWLKRLRSLVLRVMKDHPEGLSAQKLRTLVPMTNVALPSSSPSLVSQALTYLGANGDIIRGENAGHWRTARPQWTTVEDWLGLVPSGLTVSEGYRELVRRWLWRFGPGTEEDLTWWLGSTKSIVRQTLEDLAAVEVSLEGGSAGWLLQDDQEDTPDPQSWVAILPLLDSTVMGWRDRDFYFDRHRDRLLDRQGNAGPTLWVDGRVVGHWLQNSRGAVELCFMERVAIAAERALRSEAKRLTTWLKGAKLNMIRSPAHMEARARVQDSRSTKFKESKSSCV